MGAATHGRSVVVQVICLLLLVFGGGYGKNPRGPKPTAKICCAAENGHEECDEIEGEYGEACWCWCNQEHYPICACIGVF